jgi:hypothetical protein
VIDTMASEWLKVRTVRSTAYLVAAIAVVLGLGCLVSYLMTAEWDRSTPDIQAVFAAADPSVMVIPFVQFAFGAMGALVITSEYGNGMIRTVLIAVPQRIAVLLAKIVVVATGALACGLAVSFLAFGAGELITGDRPGPIGGFASWSDAFPTLMANGVSVALGALVGLGLGLLLRSTAGALVTLCGLMFVLPVVASLLPGPWNFRIVSITLPYLAPQLSGTLERPWLTPAWAGIVMVAYLVVALGAGAVALVRRDA